MTEVRPLLRLLLVAFAATVALLTTTVAQAAVPMCGENAQTVAAPPIVMPGKGHVLEFVPCPLGDLFEFDATPGDGPRQPSSVVDHAPLRACPQVWVDPLAPRNARRPIEAESPPAPSGVTSSIERPPRAA